MYIPATARCILHDALQVLVMQQLTLQIYSKVNNVLRVELWNTNTEIDILINKVLVDEGYAVRCEEPYQSKVGPTIVERGKVIRLHHCMVARVYSCR